MVLPDGMRLPNQWVPESYDVRLIPYFEPERFPFDGFVRMSLVSTVNTAQIVFHAKDMTIYEERVSVSTGEGRRLSIKGKSYNLWVRVYSYRDRQKCLYVVARSLFLLLLTCSAWPCLGPA